MGLFGFGKKEKDKMKDGLEKTRTGFWGTSSIPSPAARSMMIFTMSWKSSSFWPMWAPPAPCVWWTSCTTRSRKNT